MNWELYGAALGALGFIYKLYRNNKKDLDKRFEAFSEKMDDKFDSLSIRVDDRFDSLNTRIDDRFEVIEDDIQSLSDGLGIFRSEFQQFRQETHKELKEVRADLSEVKERMAFLEAANIYTMPIEPVKPNARSQAAIDRWARKKQKKIEKKD